MIIPLTCVTGFANFFSEKIDGIRADIESKSVDLPSSTVTSNDTTVTKELLAFRELVKMMSVRLLPLVPIKTLQSLRPKLRVIDESFETNLNWTIITNDPSFVYSLCHLNR